MAAHGKPGIFRLSNFFVVRGHVSRTQRLSRRPAVSCHRWTSCFSALICIFQVCAWLSWTRFLTPVTTSPRHPGRALITVTLGAALFLAFQRTRAVRKLVAPLSGRLRGNGDGLLHHGADAGRKFIPCIVPVRPNSPAAAAIGHASNGFDGQGSFTRQSPRCHRGSISARSIAPSCRIHCCK